MSCELANSILHGYLDGELDAVRAAEFEQHLESCRECAAALGAAESLRSSLQRAQLYETTPAALRTRIRADLKAAASAAGVERTPAWRWLAVAASILIIGTVSWFVLSNFRPGAPGTVAAAELIDAHIRSLQASHLTDVTSTDQHTVKPWFDGKLDFAPPVKDFTDEGFPLVGGRLDVLGGKSIAALVYGRRKHFVNVFVWPTHEADLAAQAPGSRQGYQWIYWRHQGMEFCAVSDVSASDLLELAQLFAQ